MTMFFMACYALGIFFACLFVCQPIRKAFDVTIREGKCASQPILNILTAIWTLSTDAIVLFLALNLVKWWRLSKVEKGGVVGIFMFGCLYVMNSIHYALECTSYQCRLGAELLSRTIVSSGIRALYLFQALHSTDITWDIPIVTVWTWVFSFQPRSIHMLTQVSQNYQIKHDHHLRLSTDAKGFLLPFMPATKGTG